MDSYGTIAVMKRLLLVCLVVLAIQGAQANEVDIRRDATVDTIAKVMPSVVNIATETIIQARRLNPLEEMLRQFYDPYYRAQPQRTRSLGSGVIIDESGYLVTNDHVVRQASRISVKLADGREFDCDRVATSSRNDIALLKIRTKTSEKFKAIRFAADDDLLLGETVIALGNPFGLGGSVSRGILSSKNRRPATGDEPLDIQDWLQTDAPINPGNSGGPLVNLKGELIGLNVAMVREAQGIGFAIPIKMVSEALAESYTPENVKSLWFGAHVKAGTLPLTIHSVQAGSPADKAGLKVGDVVQDVNGHVPHSFIEFNREVMNSAKEEATVQIARGGSLEKIKVRMVPEKTFFNAKLIQQRLGVSVQELTKELAERMGLNNVDGLLIAGIDKGSPAEKEELQRGMLITGVDQLQPPDIVETAKHLYGKKAGEKVSVQVLVPRRRGNFITIQQGKAELTLR